jgi:hypothetical protein
MSARGLRTALVAFENDKTRERLFSGIIPVEPSQSRDDDVGIARIDARDRRESAPAVYDMDPAIIRVRIHASLLTIRYDSAYMGSVI